MESKNLTKSFGVRLPLDLYMQMLKLCSENKITMTDLCLYSIMNSGIPKGEFNFEMGGSIDTDDQVKRLNERILKIEKSRNTFRICMEESDQKLAEAEIKIADLEMKKNTYHEAFSEGQAEIVKLKETIKELKSRLR
jgi:hypothetical protein